MIWVSGDSRGRGAPVSEKVTKFCLSVAKVREIFKRYQVSLCLALVAPLYDLGFR